MITAHQEVMRAEGISVDFPLGGGLGSRGHRSLRALDAVSISLKSGQTVGLVGESGSGKSTLGKALAGLVDPSEGTIEFRGRAVTARTRVRPKELWRDIRMIYQDPYSSLDPRMTIGDIVGEPLRIFKGLRGSRKRHAAAETIERCGLDPSWVGRYPHELSGGQRQRVAIARALSVNPSVLIADEPVSALDVSVQAGILNLLKDLQESIRFSMLFISHDLSVVDFISNEIAVMYLGQIVEQGPSSEVSESPRHPYTQVLLSSAGGGDDGSLDLDPIRVEGEIPSPLDPPAGCRFHTRCPVAVERCAIERPLLDVRGGTGVAVACHLVDESGRAPNARAPRG